MRTALYIFTALSITVGLLHIFVVDSFTVRGSSMAPVVISNDYIVIFKLAYLFNEPERNDIVVGNFRNLSDAKVVKRIIGLPREWVHIENNNVSVSSSREGKRLYVAELNQNQGTIDDIKYEYRLDPFEYFLLGDNGIYSVDSRELGPVDKYHINGRVIGSFRLRDLTFHIF